MQDPSEIVVELDLERPVEPHLVLHCGDRPWVGVRPGLDERRVTGQVMGQQEDEDKDTKQGDHAQAYAPRYEPLHQTPGIAA